MGDGGVAGPDGLGRRSGGEAAPQADPGSEAIEVRHLTKKFGGRTAVADVSFSVARGEVFGFLGPNGAGKTTTVRTLGTLLAPTSGSATVAGIPLTPENGVDIRRRSRSCPLIAELGRSGVTIFLTTHRLEEAERLCDRVTMLNTTLRTIGRPDELRDRLFGKTLGDDFIPLPAPGRVFADLPAVNGWRRTAPAPTSSPSPTRPTPARGHPRPRQAGADVLSIGESRHSLEDVYFELINEDEEARRR